MKTKYLRNKHQIKHLNEDGEVYGVDDHDSVNRAKKESRKLQHTLGEGSLRLETAA